MKTLIKNGKIIKKTITVFLQQFGSKTESFAGSVQHFPKQILTKSSMPKSN